MIKKHALCGKLFCAVFCVLLAVSMLAISAGAADKATSNVVFSVDKTNSQIGDIITVKVSNTAMNVCVFTGGIQFDPNEFEIVSVTPSLGDDGKFYIKTGSSLNECTLSNAVSAPDRVTLNWFKDGTDVAYDAAELMTVYLRVKAEGSLEISTYEDTSSYTHSDGFKTSNTPGDTVTVTSSGTLSSELQGSQLVIGSDLTVNFSSVLVGDDTDASLRVTVGGTSYDLASTYENGKYYFAFEGLAPQYIGDNITLELVKNATVLDTQDYSVLEYCKSLLAKGAAGLGITGTQFSALEQLIANTMDYGAKSQLYTGYKTDSLPTADAAIQALSPVAYSINKNAAKNMEPDGSTDETVCAFAGAGVYFDNMSRLYFLFTGNGLTDTNFKFVIKSYPSSPSKPDVTYLISELGTVKYNSTTYYIAYTDPIPATEIPYVDNSTYYEAALWYDENGDGIFQDDDNYDLLAYRPAAYVKNTVANSTNESLVDLVKAYYTYGLAAKAYADAD